jgi:hypothetical protein
VPADLKTKTQLGQMDPPLKPGGEPVAQALYNGNSYAPLFRVGEAVKKRQPTLAQRTALNRASDLQYVCRRCDQRQSDRLGRGRWCASCSPAAKLWEQHAEAQALAQELVADPTAVLLVVNVEPDALPNAQAVAVVGVRDRGVLYSAQAGEHGTPEREAVLDRLDSLLADLRVVEEPDFMGPSSRYPHRLISAPGQPLVPGLDPQHPWAAPHSKAHPSVARIWAPWFAWTDRPSSTTAYVPSDWGGDVPLAWSRSLDLVADGRSMAGLLHRIADGVEPVWERAAWTTDGYGVPDLSHRRRPTRKEVF